MQDQRRQLAERIAAYTEHNTAADLEFQAIRTLMLELEAGDHETVPVLLELAETAGISEQARHGQLIQTLAQAQRVKASKRMSFSTWAATHLDMSPSKARGIDQAAKEIGANPQLTQALSSGSLGADSVRVLARASKAVKNTAHDKTQVLTDMLDVVAREGLCAAKRRVQVLEETLDPGHAEKRLTQARERSFVRFTELESGMWRIEAVLDPARATTVHTAIDLHVAAWIRSRQYDGTDPIAQDIHSIEQMQAEALNRLAELFLTLDPTQHDIPFTPPTMYAKEMKNTSTKDTGTEGAGLMRTVYGQLLPNSVAAPLGHPAAHLIELHDGQPVRLDGQPIDTHPTARLATPAQRLALGYRDKNCTQPGCQRPLTWSLHAHHTTPHSQGGETTVENLTLLCPEHHTLTHQQPPPPTRHHE